MGYGHLRAAHALAGALGTRVVDADGPPLAGPEERRLWAASRRLYEITSRTSQLPAVGPPMRWLLDAITAIPPFHPCRDLSAPDRATRGLGRWIDRGLGSGLAAELERTGAALLTTYFATAVAADRHLPADAPNPLHCVATDSDLARIWVARDPGAGRLRYMAPTPRAARRLALYGVPPPRIETTGFPLPGELLGGPELGALTTHLARRLVRLDPAGAFLGARRREVEALLGPLPATADRPLTVAYVVGGAGAQAGVARHLLRALGPWVRSGRLRLVLAAGLRVEVAAAFERWAAECGLGRHLGAGVEVLVAESLDAYFRRFNARLATVDVLWTKPSELTFFAALGLPLVLTPPVGMQERYNGRWAVEAGAALRQRDPRVAAGWLAEWLADGTLAAAAWNGFRRLPKRGLYRVLERVGGAPSAGC